MMRRIVIAVGWGLALISGLNAQERYLPVYEPYGPEVLAQGRSFVAVAQGWNSLFSNPAGFSRASRNVVHLVSVTSTFLRFQDISQAVAFWKDGSFSSFSLFNPPPNPVLNFVSEVATQNGVGFEQVLGLGFVGRGLGLALVIDSSLFGKGDNLFATNLELLTSASAILGYAVPIVLVGPLNIEEEPLVDETGQVPQPRPEWVLHVGGSVRVSHNYWTEYSLLNFMALISGGSLNLAHPIYTFPMVSLSLGLLLEGRNVTVGLAVTDINARDLVDRKNDLIGVLSSFLIPTTGPKDNIVFIQPMVIRLGAGWIPDFGEIADVIQPSIHLEMRVPFKDLVQTPTWLTWFHLGGELELVRFLKLRAGFSAGNVTAGAGARFFDLWEVNLSFGSEELGQRLGEKRRGRLAVETSLKF